MKTHLKGSARGTFVNINSDDVGPRSGQRTGDRCANPSRRAGYDSTLTGYNVGIQSKIPKRFKNRAQSGDGATDHGPPEINQATSTDRIK
jgi:hypothetical protein